MEESHRADNNKEFPEVVFYLSKAFVMFDYNILLLYYTVASVANFMVKVNLSPTKN